MTAVDRLKATGPRVPRLPEDEWDQCDRDEECTGIVLPEAQGACLAHADPAAAEKALSRMLADRAYDLRGTTLPGDKLAMILAAPDQYDNRHDTNPRTSDPTGQPEVRYDLRRCAIAGPVRLIAGRVLRGYLDLSDAAFDSPVELTSCRILARLVCERTRFSRGVTFSETQFQGTAWFVSSVFMAGADFTNAAFSATVSFASAEVVGELAMPGAVFAARSDFDRVRTHWRRKFPKEGARLDLSDTVFEQRATADLSTDVVCDGARFEAGLDLRLSGGRYASLRGVRFGAAATVTGVHRLEFEVSENDDRDSDRLEPRQLWPRPVEQIENFLAPLQTRFRPPLLLSLQATDVEKLSLADVDLSHCLFAGAHNLDKLRLDGPIRFAALPRRGFRTTWNWPVVWRWSRRDVIREEYLWRMGRLTVVPELQYWLRQFGQGLAGAHDSPARTLEVITGERLAALYRSLRKAREDAKDEPGAGDFYYGEQEARRGSRSTRLNERWLLVAYWALSGYGQRASRALAALVVLLGTLTILLTGFGLADTAPIQRMTGTIQPAPPGPPQVITFDVTGQRGTATIPPGPAGTQPLTLDVATTAPTLPPPGQRWTAARAQRAVRTLVTSLVPISTDQRLTTTGAYLVLAGRVLGAFLLGLAVLAIRARVKR